MNDECVGIINTNVSAWLTFRSSNYKMKYSQVNYKIYISHDTTSICIRKH